MIRILFLWLLSLLPALAAVPSSPRPNVLFILVDDYGIKDVGIEGSTFYEKPHIDSLARSGMRFTQSYAACQVCSPSRASILLGTYPTRHSITDWMNWACPPTPWSFLPATTAAYPRATASVLPNCLTATAKAANGKAACGCQFISGRPALRVQAAVATRR